MHTCEKDLEKLYNVNVYNAKDTEWMTCVFEMKISAI